MITRTSVGVFSFIILIQRYDFSLSLSSSELWLRSLPCLAGRNRSRWYLILFMKFKFAPLDIASFLKQVLFSSPDSTKELEIRERSRGWELFF